MQYDVLKSVVRYAPQLVRATFSRRSRVGDFSIDLHAPRTIRWSIIAGNMRMHRLIDRTVRPGDTFIDVGANIGYNTLYAAARVGARGRVVAIEPAADNLAVLRQHVSESGIGNVSVHGVAAGRTPEPRPLYLRGPVSGVNSLYAESCFGAVSAVVTVDVIRLDDLLDSTPDVVKIDVEGGELDVLNGMGELLQPTPPRLIVEWHPALQVAAGHSAEALPNWLLDHDYAPSIAWHSRLERLPRDRVATIAASLLESNRSVELLAD